MAEVFLASQRGPEGFERTVAIKRILPHLADSPEFVEMFMDEARLAARLTHPNIAHIYEFGKVEDAYFIAMEYIDGIDLAPIILAGEQGLLPLAHAARIAADVAAGLNYAHEQKGPDGKPLGIVHRDISPQNILVSFDGAVKVVDFGIAKAAHHMERTQPGVIRGKYTYMSPEQVTGKGLDDRTDVFCLGIVLYELCTGKALFSRAEPMKAMTDIRDGATPEIERRGQAIPKRLSQIIREALARDPDKRYQNAAEMQLALEAFLHSTSELSSSLVLAKYFREHYRTLRPEPMPLAATAAPGEGTVAAGRPGTMQAPGPAPKTATPAREVGTAPGPGAALGGALGPLGPRGGSTGLAIRPGGGLMTSARAAHLTHPSSEEHETLIRFRGADDLPIEPGDLEPSEIGLEDDSDSEIALPHEDQQPLRDRGPIKRPAPRSRPSDERRRAGPGSERLPLTEDEDEDDDEGSTVLVDSFELRRTISAPTAAAQGQTHPKQRARVEHPAVTGPLTPRGRGLVLENRDKVIERAPSTQLVPEPTTARSRRLFGVLLAVILVPVSGVFGYFLAAPGSPAGLDAKSAMDSGPIVADLGRMGRGAALAAMKAATIRADAGPADAEPRAPVDSAAPQRDSDASSPDQQVTPPRSETATLIVTTRPRGAWVRVDGETLGRSTPTRWRGATGPREVVVGRRGYRTLRRRIRLRARRTTRLRLRLRRSRRPWRRPPTPTSKAQGPGFLTVTTVPWSTVYAGGRKLGITPLANVALPVGRHTLRFINPKTGTTTRRVWIKPGAVTRLRFKLR
ncbi:MAG: hypothetical protein CSA65_05900 [Proteobacteria bacterium]|nr:MAG: hypothetical protein CSA65_05900 [Pseudomonadota bacterium]